MFHIRLMIQNDSDNSCRQRSIHKCKSARSEKREEGRNEHIKVKRTKAGGKLSLKLPKHINNFDDITRIIYCVLECWI